MGRDILERTADNIRILSVAMVEKAGSGHPGGPMGGADFIAVLFSEFLQFDPSDPAWPNRDRFFLDPGHMSPMLYSILMLLGYYTVDDLKNFRQWGSRTPGHPELDVAHGIENTSGPLGQGHAMACGAAIAERFFSARFGEWLAHKTYAYISDGGIQEELSQGVGRLAGHLGLSNMIMFYDSNSVQLSTPTSHVTSEDTAKKYEAWGWNVDVIDGNNRENIRASLKRANAEKSKPTLIIGHTVMGKGSVTANGERFEGRVETHGMPLSRAGASVEMTIRNLGGDPDNPFAVFPEVKEYFDGVRRRKIKESEERKLAQQQWEKNEPDLARTYRRFMSGDVPAFDYGAVEQKSGIATRVASGKILSAFSEKIGNMIVSSADLCNSDNTEGFLKHSSIFRKGDFSGGFLQAGVSELTMAGVMNGIALHGGIFCVCGTFFVFSDFMKPAIRLAALMKLPVKYVWSHDSFRVGEDGPTHQPVEQEAQIRLLEKIKHADGSSAMLVLRPSDTAETSVAWKIAMENTASPTALILTRQITGELAAQQGATRYTDASKAEHGAYTVYEPEGMPDIVLVANGSEVAMLCSVAQRLKAEKGLNARVVSALSEGLFCGQSLDYKEKLFPFGMPVFGLSAGLPCTLRDMVGPFGKVVGLERFGASAPFKVLEEKFGFTADTVTREVEIYLNEYVEFLKKLSSRVHA